MADLLKKKIKLNLKNLKNLKRDPIPEEGTDEDPHLSSGYNPSKLSFRVQGNPIEDIHKIDFSANNFFSKNFGYEATDTEEEMLEKLQAQLVEAEGRVSATESKILKEKKNLDIELEVSQMNSVLEIENFVNQHESIRRQLSEIETLITIEHEQIELVGNELRDLNQLKTDKSTLKRLISVIDAYQSSQNRPKIDQKSEISYIPKTAKNGSEPEETTLQNLDFLRSALETVQTEELQPVAEQVNRDYQILRDRCLGNFKQLIKTQEYQRAREFYELIEHSGISENYEEAYLALLVGKKQIYGVTEKDRNITEIVRYLFALTRQLSSFDSKEGMFWMVFQEKGYEVLKRVAERIARDYLGKLVDRLLRETSEHNKNEFFLSYLDSFHKKFEDFLSSARKTESCWSIIDSVNAIYNNIVRKYQSRYFTVEESEFRIYLEQMVFLQIKELRKFEADRESDQSNLHIQIEVYLDKIDSMLSNESIELIINKGKETIDRCFRNSLPHKRAENCGNLIIFFMEKISSYVITLADLAERAMVDPDEPHPSQKLLFAIVGKVLFIIKRIELFFSEYKVSINNMFKLDEALKSKNQILKIVSERVSKTLGVAIQNLFAEFAQIWNSSKRRKSKQKNFESASPGALAITGLAANFVKTVKDSFSGEQLLKVLSGIGLRLVKFLELRIPIGKYSQNDLIMLNIDMAHFEGLVDGIGREDVGEKFRELKAMVDLLQVPWDRVEKHVRENEVYIKIDDDKLESFVACSMRMMGGGRE